MATLRKQDLADRVIYEVPTMPGYQIVLFKEDRFHMELIAGWDLVADQKSWQEYTAAVEADNTVTVT